MRDTRPAPPLSFFEFWPGWLFYAPVVAHWILLGLRYGDLSLPTAANPYISTGGLCGESKAAILDLVGPGGRDMIAPYAVISARPGGAAEVERAMAGAGLRYPVVLKPDIGCNGAGVRLARRRTDVTRYLAGFPWSERLMVQHYADAPHEAGLFYVRHPHEPTGQITSVTMKRAPVVTGDGRSTLRALIMADERAGRVPHLYLDRLAHRLCEVPPPGAVVPLVFVGNHCKGSLFRDAPDLATPALTATVERLARAMPEFHFGRIDVRFPSVPLLRRGLGLTVIEINGVGSEATHIWDPRTTLMEAWRAQFRHYGAAFRIGAANRRRGIHPSGLRAMYRDWKRQRRLMAAYPMSD